MPHMSFGLGLEHVVLAGLERLLGPYVKDLTREKLRVGVWSGKLVLTDLAIREDALHSLGLPLELCRGRIGRLQLRVPWSRLRTEPIELIISDVDIEVRLCGTPSAEAFVQRERTRKRLRLDTSELMCELHESARAGDDAVPPGGPSGAAPPHSFLGRLGRLVLDNLQITLLRVHLKCEQAGTDGMERSTWGATLQRFEVKASNTEGQPGFQSPSSGEPWLHHRVVLAGVAVYWKPIGLSSLAPQSFPTAMLPSTGTPDVLDDSIVVAPSNVALYFRQQRPGARVDPLEPRASCTCRVMQRIDLQLSSRQCVRLLQVRPSSLKPALRPCALGLHLRKPTLHALPAFPHKLTLPALCPRRFCTALFTLLEARATGALPQVSRAVACGQHPVVRANGVVALCIRLCRL